MNKLENILNKMRSRILLLDHKYDVFAVVVAELKTVMGLSKACMYIVDSQYKKFFL